MTDVPEGFELVSSRDASETTIRVRGEVDIDTAGQIGGALRAAAGEPGGVVVLDLSEVSFMDSSGLGVLVEHARLSMQNGNRLRIRPSPVVASLLDVSGLRARFSDIETQ